MSVNLALERRDTAIYSVETIDRHLAVNKKFLALKAFFRHDVWRDKIDWNGMILCQKGVCWTIDKDHYIKVLKQFAGQLWL